jgi:hypothetical protein
MDDEIRTDNLVRHSEVPFIPEIFKVAADDGSIDFY